MDPSDVQEAADKSNPAEARHRRRGGRHESYADDIDERLRSLRDALRAAAEGNFSVRLPTNGDGDAIFGEVAAAFNVLLERNEERMRELARISRVVGEEGELRERSSPGTMSGAWGTATESLNTLIESMTFPIREATYILSRVARGDLSRDMSMHIDGTPLQGEFFELGTTLNAVMDRLRAVSSGVSHVVREVGTAGRLGARANVGELSGTWKALVDDVNSLSGNLTAQVRNIALVSTAIAKGDLSQKVTVDTSGEILELKNVINATVDQLRAFSVEVIRVAREVGTEGKLGGQAQVPGSAGTWKDLTDSVNFMASNLTNQVRGIVKVVTAVANGDLSQKFVLEAKGEIAALADTINAMTATLRTFADQVTTVAREVGTEGKLGGQAKVPGAAGTWRDLTDNVNMLAGNLTNQVRNIAAVTTAVATGDLSQKITVDARGEILELKNTVNAMVEQLRTFAGEVTRVAREVGTEGKLGGQAQVPGVAGTWKDLTDNVNVMASNLTSQVRGIAKVVTAVASGDLTPKLVLEARGEIASLSDTINDMTDTLRIFAEQVTIVAREVGMEGKLGGQARVPGVAGTWKDLTDSVNMLAGNLTAQVRNIALVSTAIANGDLSKKITVEARGELLELKDTTNATVEQLRVFAAEVTRVAREVGTDGQLGGQARVPGVSGTWKDLTDNVNLMASNLTDQVRGISKVVTSVAGGDLTRQLVLVAKGEIATLADTINDMTHTLRTFAEQVTSVAREVGVEGKLGGQAKVPGAAGTWRDLVDNVNQLAGNLTTQVRAISDVAGAVTKGDLTRTIDVEALGEVLALKDTINQMIANLRDTTRTNKEQDWLKTNLAKFSAMMQGQRSIESLAQLIMSELTPSVSSQLGTFFVVDTEGERPVLKLVSSYGYTRRKTVANRYAFGEGLVGQAALEKKPILLTRVPSDYVPIASSLGEAPAPNILVLPILFEGNVRAVVELGSFEPFNPIHLTFLDQLAMSIGAVFNMISASRRTEELLEELKRSNTELEKRSSQLEDKASELEVRNRELAEASTNLEEKAKQLALVSKYNSEFLANMSHELRTPLNSVMLLSGLLAENAEKNLTPEQIEWAQTVQSSGRDLISLINQILDLSKIEAGRMEIEKRRVPLGEIRAYVEKYFAPLARQKNLKFDIFIAPEAPPTITTDPLRLQQIIKNLLSNAVKFTEVGSVQMQITLERDVRQFQNPALRCAQAALSFAISDTGIGIQPDKRQIIFEAFQQADTSTSRVYGGTGLGLTISRELAGLVGGEIRLRSTPGVGSTFTLYLPISPEDREPYVPSDGAFTRDEERGGYEREHTIAAAPGEKILLDASQEPPNPSSEPILAGKKFLVVDDDVRNLFAVTNFLEKRGVKVIPAADAREAFGLLEKYPDVAIVLMDVMMPEMDGFEATRLLRGDPRYAALPIVALTAKAMPGDKEKALEAGCDDFVAKPVERDQLLSVLRRWLGRDPRNG